jgi:hypothetical protein
VGVGGWFFLGKGILGGAGSRAGGFGLGPLEERALGIDQLVDVVGDVRIDQWLHLAPFIEAR